MLTLAPEFSEAAPGWTPLARFSWLGDFAGSADAIAAATPLFDAIGQKTFVVSETPKAANLVKLSGNFLLAVVIQVLRSQQPAWAHNVAGCAPPTCGLGIFVCSPKK